MFLKLSGPIGCSTAEITPPKPPVPPVYTKVPHPEGMDLGDLSSLFLDSTAPKDPDFVKSCDGDFKKLKARTQSVDELKEGMRELVAQDPVTYHWCFYGRLLDLENYLKSDVYLDEKQKAVLSTYEFLVPVARSFETDYHDSRYLRWAMTRYQHLSEWIFYRRLDFTPAGTLELVKPANPFGLYRNPEYSKSIIEKYDLAKPNTISPSAKPLTSEGRPADLSPPESISPRTAPSPK